MEGIKMSFKLKINLSEEAEADIISYWKNEMSRAGKRQILIHALRECMRASGYYDRQLIARLGSHGQKSLQCEPSAPFSTDQGIDEEKNDHVQPFDPISKEELKAMKELTSVFDSIHDNLT
jgi:hypothetical protein